MTCIKKIIEIYTWYAGRVINNGKYEYGLGKLKTTASIIMIRNACLYLSAVVSLATNAYLTGICYLHITFVLLTIARQMLVTFQKAG